MKVTATRIPDVLAIEPKVFADDRGLFYESFNEREFEAAVGRPVRFVQDNHSLSRRGVLRGIHYQHPRAQGKLVRVVRGEVYDVAVDLRRGSPTFGRWVAQTLSAENRIQLWIPEGFGHAFLVTSDVAEFLYKTTEYWYREDERSIRWDDPDIAIRWPVPPDETLLSPKDAAGTRLRDVMPLEGA